MAEETKAVPTYKLGDTIRIELELTDKSGVHQVRSRFILDGDVTKAIHIAGEGAGETSATIALEHEVTEDTAPGEYYCQYLQLIDTRGNERLITDLAGGLRFRIENVPGDHEGPELKSWRFG